MPRVMTWKKDAAGERRALRGISLTYIWRSVTGHTESSMRKKLTRGNARTFMPYFGKHHAETRLAAAQSFVMGQLEFQNFRLGDGE